MATTTVTTFDRDGQQLDQRTVEVGAEQSTGDALRQLLAASLQGNSDFLALGTPTNAQMVQQVRALTRQNNRIIRLLAGLLDSTD